VSREAIEQPFITERSLPGFQTRYRGGKSDQCCTFHWRRSCPVGATSDTRKTTCGVLQQRLLYRKCMALNEREALPGEVSLQLTGSMFSSSLEPYERSRRAVKTRLCCLAARGGVRSDSLVQNTTERDSAFAIGRNRRYSLKFIRMLDGSAYSCSVAKVFIAQGDGCFLRERQRPQRMHVRLLRIARSVGCPTRGCSSQQKSPQTPVERLSERWTGSAGKGQQQSRIRTRPASFMSLRSGVTTTTSGSVTALSKLADASSRQK